MSDNTPAFPEQRRVHRMGYETDEFQPVSGMTLRDYMAVHSTQPGCAEICKVAGVGFDGYKVYTTAADEIGIRFDDWWRAMTLEQMSDLCAKVRYAQADGMLKARES